jgi:hypothetical protein
MARLARRFGTRAEGGRPPRHAIRSLLEIAIDNVSEGCVRETYGALLGMWQARSAEDADVRATMRAIAHDEARHASLSFALHRWMVGALTPAAARLVEEARRQAWEDLRASLREPSTEVAHVAGWPTQRQAGALLRSLRTTGPLQLS